MRLSLPRIVMLALTVALSTLLVSCSAQTAAIESVADPKPPAASDTSTPESAVESYIEHISYAYRMANSEAVTGVVSDAEHIRVDAYIQLNRDMGRGIEQQIVAFDAEDISVETSRAVVVAGEDWVYRYFSLDSLEYLSPELTASYDVTYSLVLMDGEWRVNEVAATPLTEVE